MGKKKAKFLDTKNFGKNIVPAMVDASISSGGYLAGKIAANKVVEKQPKFVKAKGPAAFILGTAIAAAANEKDRTGQMLKNFGIGISTYGAAEMADAFIPEDTKAKIGLSGLGITDEEAEQIAKEAAAEVDASFSGIYDENEYLPTNDNKPIDAESYYAPVMSNKVAPTPEPIETSNPTSSTMKFTANNVAPMPEPIETSKPASSTMKFAASKFLSGIDNDYDDDIDPITEQLI